MALSEGQNFICAICVICFLKSELINAEIKERIKVLFCEICSFQSVQVTFENTKMKEHDILLTFTSSYKKKLLASIFNKHKNMAWHVNTNTITFGPLHCQWYKDADIY